MNKLLVNILRASFFALPLLLFSCKEDETERAYPVLKTHEVTDISSDGATFKASFINSSSLVIQEYGFVWSQVAEDVNVADGERISKRLALNENKFSLRVTAVLKKDVAYYLRSYVVINELMIYGNAVKFVGQGGQGPEILSISPTSGTLGDTIQLKGKRFSYQDNFVYLDNIKTTIISATDTLITFLVPDIIKNNLCDLRVETSSQRASMEGVFTFIPPSIIGLSKATVKSLDTIKVYGVYLGNVKRHVQLFLNEELIDFGYKKDTLQLVIPLSLQNEMNELKVKVNNVSDSISFNYLLPSFSESSDEKYTWLDTVSLKVNNFDHNQNSVKIKVNNTLIPIIDTSDSLVRFVISEIIDAEELQISAEVAGNEVVSQSPIFLKKPYVKGIDTDTVYFGKSVLITLGNGHPSTNQIKIGTEIIALEEVEGSLYKFTVPFSDNIYTNINENDQVRLELNANNVLSDSIITLKNPVITQIAGSEDNKLTDTLTIVGNYLSGNSSLILNFKSVIKDFTGDTQFELNNYEPTIIGQTDQSMTFSYDISGYELLDIDQAVMIDFNLNSYGRPVLVDQDTIFVDKKWTVEKFLPSFQRSTNLSDFLDEKSFADDDFGYILGGRIGKNTISSYYYEGIQTLFRFDLVDFTMESLKSWRPYYGPSNLEASKEAVSLIFDFTNEIYMTTSKNRSLIYNKGSNTWADNERIPKVPFRNGFKSGDNIIMVDYRESQKVYKYNTISKDTTSKTLQSNTLEPLQYINLGYIFDHGNSIIIYTYVNHKRYDIHEFSVEALEMTLIQSDLSIDLSNFGILQEGLIFDTNYIYKYNPLTQEKVILSELPIDAGTIKFLFKSKGRYFFNIDNQNVISIVLDNI